MRKLTDAEFAQDVVKSFERLKKENRRLTARVGALAEDEEAMLG